MGGVLIGLKALELAFTRSYSKFQDTVDEKQIDYGDEKKVAIANGQRKVKLSNGGIPGVFNCRFANPTVTNLNRKKKKPTTFVPPPPTQTAIATMGETKQWCNASGNTRQLIPFWKRPLSGAAVTQVGFSVCLKC